MRHNTAIVVIAAASLWASAPEARAADLHVPGDHATIRGALRRARPGDRIIVGPDTYEERVVCRRPGIALVGEGAIWTAPQGLRPALVIRAARVSVEGFTFDGASLDGRGRDLVVRGNTFEGENARARVRVRGRGALVEQNVVAETDTNGFDRRSRAVIDVRGRAARVRSNTVGGARDAISVRGRDLLIADNRVDGGVGTGVAVRGPSVQVLDNDVTMERTPGRPAAAGIRVRATAGDTEVRGNRVVHDDGLGIELDARAAAVVQNTVIGDGEAAGAIALLGAGSRIERNDLRGGAGPLLDVTGDAVEILRNTFTGDGVQYRGAQSGIALVGSRCTVSENSLLAFALSSAHIVGDGNLVTSNTFERAGGTRVEGDANQVTDNTATALVAAGTAFETVGANNVLERNSADGYGVGCAAEGEGNRLSDNTVRACSRDGYRALGAGNALLGNVADGCGLAGVSVEGFRNEIAGNSLVSCKRGGVAVEGGGNEVRGNEATFCSAGLSVSGNANFVLANHVAHSGAGVVVDGDHNSLDGDVLEGCGNGVYVDGNENILEGVRARDCTSGIGVAGDRNVLDDVEGVRCTRNAISVYAGTANRLTSCRGTYSGVGLFNNGEGTDVFDGTFNCNLDDGLQDRNPLGRDENNLFGRLPACPDLLD